MNVVAASLGRGAPGRVGARSTGEDSKQKTTKEAKALSSAAAKTFVLFVAFCKKSKQYLQESSLPSPAQLARRGGRKPSEFPSVFAVCPDP